jgi:hypothetical protein
LVSQNNIINNNIDVWVRVATPPKYSFETPKREINLMKYHRLILSKNGKPS